ncbi:Zinc/iron permease [Absidia repens]|uniref:Zinc/iron permease n=1 Tax=Absidia repens TaxID=90262 RepID=A0A1X2HH41_9FUNG|nr:Zinc/iron permease [Absidia repens]
MSLQSQAFAFLFPGSPMINSLLATAYISLFPNFLLYFVPPHIQPASLSTLVSFAVGGLLGDVFLHLLPHAFGGGHGGHSGGHHHHHHGSASVDGDNKQNVLVGLGIFGGFFFFFAMDRTMRMLNGGDGHGHVHGTNFHSADQAVDDKQLDANNKATNDNERLRQRKKTKTDNNKNDDLNGEMKPPVSTIKLTAYLNLLADFTHNLTDGLAMAASFYASPAVGATTAVAVFFHEIPHEIGDYALLLQSGFSKQRAMMAQFTTAGGAFLGTMIGIFIEEVAVNTTHHHHHHHHRGLAGTRLQWADLVIPMTAGGFLYIATVGVIPDLLDGKRNKIQVAREFAAMGIGMAVMATIAWNEV